MTSSPIRKVSDAQLHALTIIAESGNTTASEVATEAGVSKDIARETLRHLEERDLVERTSDIANTYYGAKNLATFGSHLMRNCDGINGTPTPPWEQ